MTEIPDASKRRWLLAQQAATPRTLREAGDDWAEATRPARGIGVGVVIGILGWTLVAAAIAAAWWLL